MRLVYGTSEYVLGWRPAPGFPILLNEDMSSCSEVNEFFRFYLQRGAIESSKSWEPISRSLYDFFGFLEAHELDWKDVERGEDKNLVAAYRDYSFGTSGHSRNTVKLRLVYVSEFYKYALRKGWIHRLPFTYEARRRMANSGFFAHLSNGGGETQVNSVMPRQHRHLIKFLSIEQARRLLTASSNIHHVTLIRFALSTGLRREELATFPLAYVFNPDTGSRGDANVSVVLDPNDGSGMRTKGSKSRRIFMPQGVMRGLRRYADQMRGERASLSQEDQSPLFLNQNGLPFARDGKGIESIVRKLGRRVGIEVHPHMLRHTYATHTLSSLQKHRRDSRIEPVVFLQQQLGHESLQTTMEYLHLINELADDAVLAYDEEIHAWNEEQG